jgi:hypothetical protein
VILYEINRMFEVRMILLKLISIIMKKIAKYFQPLVFVLPASLLLLFCSWRQPNPNHFYLTRQTDTVPGKDNININLDMQGLTRAMDELNIQMKNMNIDFNKQLESLSKVNFDQLAKQTEASLKAVDWNKMQVDINNSLQTAQTAMAKIDFTKLQDQIKTMQEKFQTEEFKSQFNNEKIQKEIADAMSKAKVSIEKAKQKMQRMKDFTDALAADGLIDKKKGYTIKWENGNLFINGKEQAKSVSDRYRKYEDAGEIKMLPDGAERF